MKKIILLLVTIILLANSVFAATVNRDMPSRIVQGTELKVTFYITNAQVGKTFTLEESIPAEFTIKKYDVTGYAGTVNTRIKDNRNGWSFEANTTNPTITYYIDIPKTPGTYTFDAVWFDQEGQNRDKKTLVVAEIKCGDNYCDAGETEQNCVADCKAAALPSNSVPAITGAATANTTGNQLTGAAVQVKAGFTRMGDYFVANSLIVSIIIIIIVIAGVITFIVVKRKGRKKKHS